MKVIASLPRLVMDWSQSSHLKGIGKIVRSWKNIVTAIRKRQVGKLNTDVSVMDDVETVDDAKFR